MATANEILIKLAADSSALVTGLDGASRRIEAFGRKMESIGIRIGGIGVAANAGLSQAGLGVQQVVSGAIEAERALLGIANTAGLSGEAAKKSVDAWGEQLGKLAETTNQTRDQTIVALQDLVSRGFAPEKAMQMLESIGRAATATGANISDMAKSSFAAVDNLKISVGDLGKSLDIMAAAGNAGSFELRDMAQYFPQLTSNARMLGDSGSGALASLAAAAQIAMKGAGDTATAANNLANFMAKLSSPDAVKKFKDAGVDLAAAVKQGVASGDLIGYMGETIQKMTGGDATKLAALFTDKQARDFIAPLVANLEEYKAIRDEALGGAGTVDTQFATAMQGTGAQLDALKIKAEAAISQGGALDLILGKLNSILDWANAHPEMAAWLAMGAFGVAVGGMAIGGAVTAIGAISTAIGALMPVLTGLSAFLIANPVVAAILGAVAVGVAVYTYWDDIVAAMKKALNAIKATLKEWRTIGENIINGIWEGIKATIRKPLDAIGELAKQLPKWAKDLLGIHSPSTVFAEIGENIGAGLVEGIEQSAPAVQGAADKLVEAVIVEPSGRARTAGGKFKSAADVASQGTGLIGGLKEYAASIRTMEDSIKDVTVRTFKGMEDALVGFVTTGKLNFKSLASSIVADMIRIQIQQNITRPLAAAFSGMSWGGLFGNANGGVYGGPGIGAFSGQIVSQPTVFPFAKGIGLMGEAGPEAILPLTRVGGKLGVQATAAAPVINIEVNNNAAGQVQARVEQHQGPQGTTLQIQIDQIEAGIARNVARGRGALANVLGGQFGLNRAAGAV